MKTELTNQQIEMALVDITGSHNGRKVKKGLIEHKLSMGFKNRLQKLVRKLSVEYQDYIENLIELLKKHGAVNKDNAWVLENSDTNTAYQAEFKELSGLICTIDFDPLDFSFIENVETDEVFDFELLELICESKVPADNA